MKLLLFFCFVPLFMFANLSNEIITIFENNAYYPLTEEEMNVISTIKSPEQFDLLEQILNDRNTERKTNKNILFTPALADKFEQDFVNDELVSSVVNYEIQDGVLTLAFAYHIGSTAANEVASILKTSSEPVTKVVFDLSQTRYCNMNAAQKLLSLFLKKESLLCRGQFREEGEIQNYEQRCLEDGIYSDLVIEVNTERDSNKYVAFYLAYNGATESGNRPVGDSPLFVSGYYRLDCGYAIELVIGEVFECQ